VVNRLLEDEFFGEIAREKLLYYPTVTREEFRNTGRITTLLESGKLQFDLGLPKLSLDSDRVMLCGSPEMLHDLNMLLKDRGFAEGNHSDPGHYVIEKAFVEK
jgi:ferredoxin--NADP+ reductase